MNMDNPLIEDSYFFFLFFLILTNDMSKNL